MAGYNTNHELDLLHPHRHLVGATVVLAWLVPLFNDCRGTGRNPDGSQDAGNHVRRIVTMWITNSNDSCQSLKIDGLDEPVEFSDSGTAQVSEEVGELLIEQCDTITEKDN